ncbi:MAG TPA: glycosyltransferase [Nevskiaceae bacterium]|nr:glycosyltransferase [Nevskiaceae bacterium]
MPLSRVDPGVVVATWTFPLLSETFVLDHVLGLAERGRRVSVLCEHPGPVAGLHDELGPLLRRLPRAVWRPGSRWLRLSIRLRGLGDAAREDALLEAGLRRLWRPGDLVHAHFGPAGERLARLRRQGRLPAPLLVSLHGFDVTREPPTEAGAYRHLFEGADRLIATTAFIAQRALALGCPPAKLCRLPLGIRLDAYPFRRPLVGEGRPLQLLSIARLVEKKGIGDALEAVARLRAAGVDCRYQVIGEGPLRPLLEQQVGRLGLQQSVSFLGARTRQQVAAVLAEADLFLFPSVRAADGDQEGQGMALIEAQACGLLVVATRSGGIPESLQEGVNGLLVDERAPEQIAAAVQALLARRAEWPALAEAGRAWVERQFCHRQHLDQLEALYAELAAARGVAP